MSCYSRRYDNWYVLLSHACDIFSHIQGNKVAIDKLLKLAEDPAVGFIKYAADPDVAPIIAVINSGRSNPCS